MSQLYRINWNSDAESGSHSTLISFQSFTPQEGHSFANPHVMVVEVAQAGEGDGRQKEEASISHLDFKVSVNIICHNLPKTPEK